MTIHELATQMNRIEAKLDALLGFKPPTTLAKSNMPEYDEHAIMDEAARLINSGRNKEARQLLATIGGN